MQVFFYSFASYNQQEFLYFLKTPDPDPTVSQTLGCVITRHIIVFFSSPEHNSMGCKTT